MARYVREVKINQSEDFVNFMVNDFLTKHGFKYVSFKGEMVYRSGDGFFTIPKLFVWNYQNGIIHIEAWTRNVWLPGVYGKENALNGYMGCIPKGAYKSDVEELLQLLMQQVPQQGMAGDGTGQMANGPIMVQGVDTSRYANMSLAFGILGLVIFCVPYMSLLMGILSIIYSNKARTSSKRGRATAGMICGIIAIIVAVILLVLNILGVFAGLI